MPRSRTNNNNDYSMPGPSIPESELRALVRERIAAHVVPVMLVAHLHAGYGNDDLCCICREAIQHSHIEYDVREGDGHLAFHMTCYALWQLECAQQIREAKT
jgi:hypothetical protein